MKIQNIKIALIKKYMSEKKITYSNLSLKSGIPVITLQDLFRGKTKNPRIDTLEAIIKALDIPNYYLYEDDESALSILQKVRYSNGQLKLISLIDSLTEQNKLLAEAYIQALIDKQNEK